MKKRLHTSSESNKAICFKALTHLFEETDLLIISMNNAFRLLIVKDVREEINEHNFIKLFSIKVNTKTLISHIQGADIKT